jgi:hypothetical protein
MQSVQVSTAVVAAAEAAAVGHSFPRLNHLAARERLDKATTVVAAILEMAPCRLIHAAAAVEVAPVLLATRPADRTQRQMAAAVVQGLPIQSLELRPRTVVVVVVVVQVMAVRHPVEVVVAVVGQINRTALHRKQGQQIRAAAAVAPGVFSRPPPPSEIPAGAVL